MAYWNDFAPTGHYLSKPPGQTMTLNASFHKICVSLIAATLLAAGCQSVKQRVADVRKSPQEKFAARLSDALNTKRGGAMLAAQVIDLQTGEEWFSQNPDTPMIPASNGKLAISAAGLAMFGPAHTFKTYLVRDGDDLWIIGTGDPGCGDPKIAEWRGETVTTMFDAWADAMKRRGLTKVKGNLIYWDGAFDRELTYTGWKPDFLVDWYGAPVSGLNFNDNCIDIKAFPGADGQPARLEVVPANDLAVITNKTVTNGEGTPAIDRAASAPQFTITGGVSKETKLESKPVTDPGAFFADAFRVHMKSRGISIDGETRRAEALPFSPAGPMFDRIIATHETSMSDVLKRINKNSQNMFAEAMSKALGREWMFRRGQSVPGSWKLGEAATKEFLWANRINAGSYVAADGSGLDRTNQVTARLITDLLVTMHHRRDGKLWRESLAVAGVDGTIGKRMADMEGRVMAKTGYISGVRSLSGYVHTKNGKWLAFSFIYNEIDGSVKPYEVLQDNACRVMYHWPEKPIFPAAAPLPAASQPAEPTTAPSGAEPASQPTPQPASMPAV